MGSVVQIVLGAFKGCPRELPVLIKHEPWKTNGKLGGLAELLAARLLQDSESLMLFSGLCVEGSRLGCKVQRCGCKCAGLRFSRILVRGGAVCG